MLKKVEKKYVSWKRKYNFSINFNADEYCDEIIIDNHCVSIDDMIHCCGISEIGNFPQHNKYENEKYNIKTNFDNFSILFDNILRERPKTYIINSNGKGFCKFIDAYMNTKQGKNRFTCVKTFINRSSLNTIKMYISNNITL